MRIMRKFSILFALKCEVNYEKDILSGQSIINGFQYNTY